jgi:hypothetical protein
MTGSSHGSDALANDMAQDRQIGGDAMDSGHDRLPSLFRRPFVTGTPTLPAS